MPGPPVHNDLVSREFTADAPNRLWFTDITEHATDEGGATAIGTPPAPSWNVAPTQDVPVLVERHGDSEAGSERELRTMRWGLVPSWAESPKVGSRMINARIETLTERPAYRAALERRRCLVPTIGYYEWERSPDGSKMPTFLHRDGQTQWFAGLHDLWRDPASPDEWLRTFTVVTTTAPDGLGHIHHRSPVIVSQDLHDDWLDPQKTDAATAITELAARPPTPLAVRRVGPCVNDHRNNGPHLIEAVQQVLHEAATVDNGNYCPAGWGQCTPKQKG